jgi:hypothetical protein
VYLGCDVAAALTDAVGLLGNSRVSSPPSKHLSE